MDLTRVLSALASHQQLRGHDNRHENQVNFFEGNLVVVSSLLHHV